MQPLIELLRQAKDITQPTPLAALLYLGLVGLVALAIHCVVKTPQGPSVHRLLRYMIGIVAILAIFILLFVVRS